MSTEKKQRSTENDEATGEIEASCEKSDSERRAGCDSRMKRRRRSALGLVGKESRRWTTPSQSESVNEALQWEISLRVNGTQKKKRANGLADRRQQKRVIHLQERLQREERRNRRQIPNQTGH